MTSILQHAPLYLIRLLVSSGVVFIHIQFSISFYFPFTGRIGIVPNAPKTTICSTNISVLWQRSNIFLIFDFLSILLNGLSKQRNELIKLLFDFNNAVVWEVSILLIYTENNTSIPKLFILLLL